MRCLTLAGVLKKQGWECAFLTIEDSQKIIPALGEFEIHDVIHEPEEAALLIVDHYDLNQEYETKARQWAHKIVVIDDLADRPHDCDVLIDQTMGRDAADYKDLVPAHCNILCGSDYTMLRPQFIDRVGKAKEKRGSAERAENILVTFGSTNPDNIIQKIVSVLLKFEEWPLTIDVVVSSQAQGVKDIQELAAESTKNTIHTVEVNLDVEDMAAFMLDADLAFGGGGTTSWERACLGLPTLLIGLSPDQKIVAKNLHELEAVSYLGELGALTEVDIDNGFKNMRDNKTLLRQMSEKSFSVCDGKGTERLCKIIEETMQEQVA